METYRKQKTILLEQYQQVFTKITDSQAHRNVGDCQLLCGSRATNRLSPTCQHYFCKLCIRDTFAMIVESGQFPALCPGCRAANTQTAYGRAGLKGQAGKVTKGILADLVQKRILSDNKHESFELAFRYANLQPGADQAKANKQKIKEFVAKELKLSKECPNPKCGERVSHFRGHGCHHIMPGKGCPFCGKHFCYACLMPYGGPGGQKRQCASNCPFNCNANCDCPTCPKCTPGNPCKDCDTLPGRPPRRWGCPACKPIKRTRML